MKNEKFRMDAYYYGFDETGQEAIDLILSAVACAGESFHHTDQWNDEDSPWPGHTGNSPIEWIANAALSGAQEMAQLKAENDALRKDAERYRWLKRQRSKAWKAAAEIPMNHTDAHIDEAMAKEKSHD